MTAETDLLPLPEWTKRDDLGGLVPSEVRVEMCTYARANVAHAIAPLQAEIEALRAERDRAMEACQLISGHLATAEARAERLAEALREARECALSHLGLLLVYDVTDGVEQTRALIAKIDAALEQEAGRG